MRRKDREIKDIQEIIEIIEKCDTLRLGLFDKEYPYIIPVSYGYEINNNQIIFYIHGAMNGKKLKLIEKNKHVCVEMDMCHQFIEMNDNYTCTYESVIGYGDIKKVNDNFEKRKGLDLILKHCGFQDYHYQSTAVEATSVHKIIVNKVTGKRRVIQ